MATCFAPEQDDFTSSNQQTFTISRITDDFVMESVREGNNNTHQQNTIHQQCSESQNVTGAMVAPEEGTVLVNSKQYLRIVKRRITRNKMVEEGRIPPPGAKRQDFLYKSRSTFAKRRVRNYDGQFRKGTVIVKEEETDVTTDPSTIFPGVWDENLVTVQNSNIDVVCEEVVTSVRECTSRRECTYAKIAPRDNQPDIVEEALRYSAVLGSLSPSPSQISKRDSMEDKLRELMEYINGNG